MTAYLLDTSVVLRHARSDAVADAVLHYGAQGPLFRCALTELETLRATASGHFSLAQALLRSSYPELPVTTDVLDRAREVQGLLAANSQHQGVKVSDLVVAACAELNDGATVLHYEADYDAIASVTGQGVEWVVPRGTAD